MVDTVPPTILVVDDSRENADILRRFLELRGFPTVVAHGADEAIRAFDASSPAPSLVLLDVMMPGRDGWTVCGEMRARPHGRDTRIVMLTALGSARTQERARQIGADDIIAKPIDLPDLLACVKRNLDARTSGASVWERPAAADPVS